MRVNKILWICASALALVALAAAEPRYAVTLRNGFVLHAERTETRNDQVALLMNGGEILLSSDEIGSVEELPFISGAPLPGGAYVAQPTAPTAEPRSVPEVTPVPELIRVAAEMNGLPEAFVRSVAQAESGLRADAVSPKGALGVMQLMPGTAAALGVDPHNPAENIEGGARLLRSLLLQYRDHPDQVRRALAAYNAGAGAVQKYNGIPPYRETQLYVERVLRRYRSKVDAWQEQK